jgi:hypothetical protein
MTRFYILLISVLFSVSVSAETVYKKTQPDGSVEFTDRESKDSEEVKIRKPTTFTAPRLPRLTLPSKKLSPSFKYELVIIKPVNNTTIHNKPDVLVSITLQPSLSSGYGHQIQYQLGAQSITSDKTSVIFKNVDRGTHSVNVSIVDSEGEIVSPVASSTFHLKRFFKKPPPPKVKPKTP